MIVKKALSRLSIEAALALAVTQARIDFYRSVKPALRAGSLKSPVSTATLLHALKILEERKTSEFANEFSDVPVSVYRYAIKLGWRKLFTLCADPFYTIEDIAEMAKRLRSCVVSEGGHQ